MYDRIEFVEVPYSFGIAQYGPELGPAAFKESPAYKRITEQYTGSLNSTTIDIDKNRECASANVSNVCFNLAREVEKLTYADTLPIVIGGDHSVELGALHGASCRGTLGVLWLDAHPDFNTFATSPSGNIHGMALAGAVGDIPDHPTWEVDSLAEENISIVGARNIDIPHELNRVRQSDISIYHSNTVEKHGISPVLDDAIDTVTSNVDSLHVSIDMDVFDPETVPGVSTRELGGLSKREGLTMIRTLASDSRVQDTLSSLSIVETNPLCDTENMTGEFAAKLVEQFIQSALMSH